MLWGATLFRLPVETKREALPRDYQSAEISTLEQIFAVLWNLFPHQQHQWGKTSGSEEIFWVEFLYETSGLV